MPEFDFENVKDILVCPLSHARLILHDGALVSTDPQTRMRYEIDQGIPRLLVDNGTQLSEAEWQTIMEAADKG